MDKDELLKRMAIIEKSVAEYVTRETEKLRTSPNDPIPEEVMMNVAALFAARAVVVVHIWHGEKLASISKRLFANFEQQVKRGIEIYREALAPQKGGRL